MKEEKYLEMPWSMEDTIENLQVLKKAFQKNVLEINLDGKGEQDAKEVEFDFNRAIEALEKQIPKKVIRVQTKYGSPCRCPHCEADISEVHFIDVHGRNHKEKITWCWSCGNAIDWSVEDGSS